MNANNLTKGFIIGALWFLSAVLPSRGLDSTKAFDQYVHQAWTSSDGLPQHTIHAILQTRDGYIWLATAEGLVRFDGTHFTLFDKRAIPGLSSTDAELLLETSDGALWIAFNGTGGGLAKYADGRFELFTTANGLPSYWFTALVCDRNGKLLVGTKNGLVIERKERFSLFSDDLRLKQAIHGLTVVPDGVIWAATDKALLRLNSEVQSVAEFPLDIRSITKIYFDRSGTLWVGTQHDGLYSVFKGRVIHHADEFRRSSISAIYEDRDKTLWVGSLGGGVCKLLSKFECYMEQDGLTSNDVDSIYQDREGSVWVGTLLGGLNRLKSNNFRTYAVHARSTAVWAIYAGQHGDVWAGTDAGLAQIRGNRTVQYNLGTTITGIQGDQAGGLWLATLDGVKEFRNGNVTHTYTIAQGLPANRVNALHEDHKGNLWIGTIGSQGGLVRITRGKTTVFNAKDGLATNRIHTIIEDHKGVLWFGTTEGVSSYENGKFSNYPIRSDSESEGGDVNCIYEDASGDLWIGTGGYGLARMHNGAMTFFTQTSGMYDDNIWSVLEDDEGQLWMTSNRGLFRVHKTDLMSFDEHKLDRIPYVSYGTKDGLVTSEFNGGFQSTAAKTADGKMWFASIKGIVEFDQGRISRNLVPPPVRVETASLDHATIQNGARISVGGGRLEFQFVGLSFLTPDKVRYKYKLEGFDKDWISAGNRNSATYTNVPPGTYRFRVIASNNDGVWNNEGASFDLILQPHYYQSWPFRIFCGFVALAIPFAIVTIRQQSQKRMERKLEELIGQRSKELMKAKEAAEATAEAKTRLLANISHEIRTPVNGLLGMVELIRDAGLTPQQLDLSEAAIYSGNALLNVLNQILDFSALEAGKAKVKQEELEISKTIDSVRHMFSALVRQKNLDLAFHISPEIPGRVLGDPNRFYQVLLNLIGNAIKFTDVGGVTVSADVVRSSGSELELQVCVADTGIGIHPDHQKVIFEPFKQVDDSLSRKFGGTGLGLPLASGLVALMGGRIWVESEPDKGAKFFFTVLFGLPVVAIQGSQSQTQPVSTTSTSKVDNLNMPVNILVVEDNEINRKFAISMLRKQGYQVGVAENGREALERLKESSFDVILMDIQMPVMDGLEATLEIRRLEQDTMRHIPIVALTAHASPEDRERCLHAGMDEYLSKPISGKNLAATIAEVYQRLQSASRPDYKLLSTG